MEGIDVHDFPSGAFCQCVSIAKVVNFYVFDVVPPSTMHISLLNVVVLDRLEDFPAPY